MTDHDQVDSAAFIAMVIGKDQALAAPDEKRAADMFQQFTSIMRGMADMLRVTNERMESLERKVTLLEKVTPAQVTAINAAVRNRAYELGSVYHVADHARVANAIRKDIKLTHGVRCMRDLPRVVYKVVETQVFMWDDYKTMKRLKVREENK